MELTLEQRRALLDRVDAWNRAPEGTRAGIAWAAVENYVASLVREGEGERKRLAERCESLAWMYDHTAAENDDLRNRLELIETACTAHRVERADWHAQAAEELARAEVSTAGHGDPHDDWRPL